MERSRDAALAARDTDQGAGDALAQVERLCDQAEAAVGSPINSGGAWVAVTNVRAALARATPKAREGKSGPGHDRHDDPYCVTHCRPGIKHSQCACTFSHATPEQEADRD
jgi:hypothetical protein